MSVCPPRAETPRREIGLELSTSLTGILLPLIYKDCDYIPLSGPSIIHFIQGMKTTMIIGDNMLYTKSSPWSALTT